MQYRQIMTLRQEIALIMSRNPEYELLDAIQQDFEQRNSVEYQEIAKDLEIIVERLLAIANSKINCNCFKDLDSEHSEPKTDIVQLGSQIPNGYPKLHLEK